jgi:hypothetical protein
MARADTVCRLDSLGLLRVGSHKSDPEILPSFLKLPNVLLTDGQDDPYVPGPLGSNKDVFSAD